MAFTFMRGLIFPHLVAMFSQVQCAKRLSV